MKRFTTAQVYDQRKYLVNQQMANGI